jgi:hypothetical protein
VKTLDYPKNTILKGGISRIAFFLLLTQKDPQSKDKQIERKCDRPSEIS